MAEAKEEVIAHDGDVIINMIGSIHDGGPQRLRVSRSVLSAASPYFKKRLDPLFDRLQDPPTSNNPVTIGIPACEGLSKPVSRLCRLLHADNGGVLIELMNAPLDLFYFATIVDFCECTKATERLTSGILAFAMMSVNYPQTAKAWWYMAAAAYLLRLPFAFSGATKWLIFNTRGKIEVPCEVAKHEPMMKIAQGDIENQRANLYEELLAAVKLSAECTDGRHQHDKLLELTTCLQAKQWSPNLKSLSLLVAQKEVLELEEEGTLECRCWEESHEVNFHGFCARVRRVAEYGGLALDAVLERAQEVSAKEENDEEE